MTQQSCDNQNLAVIDQYTGVAPESTRFSTIHQIMSKIMLSTLWNTVVRRPISVQPIQSPRLFSSCCINHLPTAAAYAKIKADPERHQRYLVQVATWRRNRYWKDPEHRSEEKEKSRLRSVGYRNTRESYARRTDLYNWVVRYTWFRDLPWKSHRPLLYQGGIKHTCSSCGMSRNNGSKLWWTKTGTFTCHTCS